MTISKSKVVVLKFKMRYDEIITSVNLLQGLNNDITVQAKVSGGKVMNLGLFTIGSVTFDKDGNSNIQFKSLLENVNMDNISEVAGAEQEDIIQLRFMAVLELPGEESEE